MLLQVLCAGGWVVTKKAQRGIPPHLPRRTVAGGLYYMGAVTWK